MKTKRKKKSAAYKAAEKYYSIEYHRSYNGYGPAYHIHCRTTGTFLHAASSEKEVVDFFKSHDGKRDEGWGIGSADG